MLTGVSGKLQTATTTHRAMAKKLYFESELNSAWRAAREKAIQRGRTRGHSKSSGKNDKKLTLYLACEFQDLGIERPEDVTDSEFLAGRDLARSDQNRSGKGITEKGFKKR